MKKTIAVRIVPNWNQSHKWSVEQTKDAMDQISPTFCAAKWKQTTIHLQNGHTHSCHHPGTHKVPLEELEKSPSALHNTHKKMLMREQMQNGERPPECEYCWKVEDSGGTSDRLYKTRAPWSGKHVPDLVIKNAVHDHPPSYLEVSFGNVCNFKCAYCAPHISSKWMEEIQQHGGYPTSYGYNDLALLDFMDAHPIPNKDPNPYVDAFWEYFPTIAHELHVLRITGGEPLLNKNTFRLFDWLIENPQPELEFAINTNLNVPQASIDKALNKLNILQNRNCVKRVEIHTSAEATGEANNYIRYGMDYNQWKKNLKKAILTLPGTVHFNIMSTFNVMSFGTYGQFLKDMHDLKQIARSPAWTWTDFPRLKIDIPYLRNPPFLSMFVLNKKGFDKTWFTDQLRSFYKYMSQHDFDEHELSQMDRLMKVFDKAMTSADAGPDFVKYIDEYDKRRGTDFHATFPELKSLYEFFK